MHQPHDWLERKIQMPRRRLRKPAQATEEFRRHTGPRYLFGKLTLSAIPASEFSYISRVQWPVGEQVQLYEDSVLDGILDILLIEQPYPVLGVAVTLEQIVWHEVDSCAFGYSMAARQAMRCIIGPGSDGRSLNYELIK